MRHIAALLMLVSFVMLAACYVPSNHIKAKLQHPMTLAVKVWALAHLLANGTLAGALLCFRLGPLGMISGAVTGLLLAQLLLKMNLMRMVFGFEN